MSPGPRESGQDSCCQVQGAGRATVPTQDAPESVTKPRDCAVLLWGRGLRSELPVTFQVHRPALGSSLEERVEVGTD